MKSVRGDKSLPSSLVEKINTIKDLVVESLNPDSVILFGSRAGGNCKKGSYIDLAVETSKRLTTRQRRLLIQKIEDIAGIYSVDIVFSSTVNEDFFRHIKQNGQVLYEAR